MRGRQPKPLEEHRREGTFEKSRHGKRVVSLGGRKKPTKPPHLSSHQAKAWKVLVADLWDTGTLDHADAGILEAAAVFWGRAREAREILADPGNSIVIQGKLGSVVHPAVKIERESWDKFRQVAEQLGLSPSARARLGLANTRKRSMQREMESQIGASPRSLHAVGDD